ARPGAARAVRSCHNNPRSPLRPHGRASLAGKTHPSHRTTPARRSGRMVAPRWPGRHTRVTEPPPLAAPAAWSRLAGREDTPESPNPPRSPLRALDRVAEEHGDRRRAHPADPRGDGACDLLAALVDVGEELPTL